MRCRDCGHYTYESENDKGYCDWYRTYYWPDDYCDHHTDAAYEEEEEEEEE